MLVYLDLLATLVLQVTNLRLPAVTSDIYPWCCEILLSPIITMVLHFNPLLLNMFIPLSSAVITDLKEF